MFRNNIETDNMNTQTVILPYKEHITKAWPEHNFLISIVRNKPTSYDWIMNTYIQTYSCQYISHKYEDRRVSFYPFAQFSSKAGFYDLCPFINKYSIPNTFIKKHYNRFTDFLEESIKNNYYVGVSLDQYNIRSDVRKSEVLHPNYIYGYDLSKRLIYVTDNFENGIYTTKEVSFDVINESYVLSQEKNNKEYDASTFLYELIDYNYIFDLSLMLNLLKDYINPQRGVCYLHSLSYYKNLNAMYTTNLGINCYDLLFDYLNEILSDEKNEKNKIDIRSFSFYIDHKRIMKLRYEYLVDNKYILLEPKLHKEFEDLEKKCLIVQTLFLKYSINNDVKIIQSIKEKLEEIRNIDRESIEYLIEKLEISTIMKR